MLDDVPSEPLLAPRCGFHNDAANMYVSGKADTRKLTTVMDNADTPMRDDAKNLLPNIYNRTEQDQQVLHVPQ